MRACAASAPATARPWGVLACASTGTSILPSHPTLPPTLQPDRLLLLDQPWPTRLAHKWLLLLIWLALLAEAVVSLVGQVSWSLLPPWLPCMAATACAPVLSPLHASRLLRPCPAPPIQQLHLSQHQAPLSFPHTRHTRLHPCSWTRRPAASCGIWAAAAHQCPAWTAAHQSTRWRPPVSARRGVQCLGASSSCRCPAAGRPRGVSCGRGFRLTTPGSCCGRGIRNMQASGWLQCCSCSGCTCGPACARFVIRSPCPSCDTGGHGGVAAWRRRCLAGCGRSAAACPRTLLCTHEASPSLGIRHNAACRATYVWTRVQVRCWGKRRAPAPARASWRSAACSPLAACCCPARPRRSD